jgi:hypothetical protein
MRIIEKENLNLNLRKKNIQDKSLYDKDDNDLIDYNIINESGK